jgi:ADP-dependent NAD(P)H-hydrate dehydratase
MSAAPDSVQPEWQRQEIDRNGASLPPLPLPDGTSSKYERGTVLVVAGGPGCPGAALLSAAGALRGGAGRVQILTHEVHAVPASIAFPEASVLSYECRAGGAQLGDSALRRIREADAVLVGPGLASEGPELARIVLAESSTDACVLLDAAALAGVEPAPLRPRCVLLPNAKEVALVAEDADAFRHASEDVGSAAIELARRTESVAVVRGAATAIADPGDRVVRVLDDPCPGLGVAGSGDVLAGVVAAFCARARELATGAAWGVLVHHEAGRILEHVVGELGFLAREIGDRVPSATQRLLAGSDPTR